MGCQPSKASYKIVVKTGDHKGAGSDSNVHIILVNTHGNQSRIIPLDCIWRNDFERGSKDTFPVSGLENFGDIADIQLWRTGIICDAWYIEWIKVHNLYNGKCFMFPICRWMASDRLMQFQEYDCVLPQFSKFPQQRKMELEEKKKEYAFAPKIEGLPCE
ncbi:arachidonate 5-lipoxygenase-like, partial [Anneissia japonica]|uniref:arachidonate 5-lipoxygenase-like n=1 Tax=Anneissia japonica TaxID=1529436 RepID=UPI0014256A28